MERRTFIQTCTATWTLSSIPGFPGNHQKEGTPFFELSPKKAQELMSSGNLSSVALTRYYLDRMAAIDQGGPNLNSILEINPDAMAIAEKMDQIRKTEGPLSPIHGLPFLVKGNIASHDRMDTSAGSLALAGHKAPRDAFHLEKLRRAGAVFLGKTNLSEWANFRSTRSSSGWSSQGGQTRNPYSLDRTPCGSSAGSGVAVAADLCIFAVGTETDGSIVCPSGINGIVGIKPTLGLVSRSGIIPLSHSQDTAGPMARTVAAAVALLSAMAGRDKNDSAAHATLEKYDFSAHLIPGKLKGSRIGVMRHTLGFHEGVDKIFNQVILDLKSAGATVVDPISFEGLEAMGEDEYTVLLYEFKHDLNSFLKSQGVPAQVDSLEKLIAFNLKHESQVMPWFKQEIFEMAQAKGDLREETYLKALANCKKTSQIQGIDRVMKEHNLDALVAPTNGPAWKIDLVNGDHFLGGSSSLAAISGYPSITVPSGYVSGLPIGLSFIGNAFSEGKLIELAYDFEQKTKHRVPPKYAKTVDI